MHQWTNMKSCRRLAPLEVLEALEAGHAHKQVRDDVAAQHYQHLSQQPRY